jgi:serine/threonine protein kinase/tetratricopeptide (TPR) repeat protein
VDLHLDTCVECRSLVAALLHTNHDLGPQAGDPFSLRQGAIVGRYMLLEMVGEGAMGTVFAAYDPELHRKVAIKFVRSSAGASSDRLLREAQAMARLSHPNVVTIYETGKVDDSVFIAMELVAGTTLREWLRAETRSLREIVDLHLQAARGLQAAHAAGLVHRDFKPDNVLIADDGRARVTDFGLARGEEDQTADTRPEILALGSGELTQTMTRTGSLLGTPAYMAPEQLRGEEASSSADQYAFCVTLFEALCARRPFEGDSIAALLRSAKEDKPKFRSDYSVPKALQTVLLRGLEPLAGDRFASMGELITAAEAASSGSSRRRMAGAGFAMVGVAAAAALFISGGSDNKNQCADAANDFDRVWTPERQSELQQALAKSDASFASRTQESVAGSLHQWRGQWITERTNTCKATRVSKSQSEVLMDVRMQCLQRGLSSFDALTQELTATTSLVALRDFEQALPDVAACRDTLSLSAIANPLPNQVAEVEKIEAQIARAVAQIATGAYTGAQRIASDAHQRALTLGYLPLVSTTALALARAEQKLGNLSKASDAVDTASTAALESRSERVVVSAWIQAVAIYGEMGKHQQALQSAGYARAGLERISEAGRLRAMLANNWGTVLYRMGSYAEAREHLERSRQLRVTLFGEESTLVSRSLTNLGNLERESGNWEKALVYHRKAQAVDAKVLGEAHPEIGRHLHNIGGVLRLDKTKRSEAVAIYEQALALRRKALGPIHQDVANTLNSLGLVHADMKEHEKAKAYYMEALSSYPDPEHPQRALSLYGLGLLEHDEKAHADAQQHFRSALSMFERSYKDDHKRVLHVLLALSKSLLATGDRAEAKRLAMRAQATGNPEFKKEIALALSPFGEPALPTPKTRPAGKPAASKVEDAKTTAVAPECKPSPPKPATPINRGMYGSSPAWD